MNHKVLPPQHQVFINFRGAELRNNFISYLVEALERNDIKIFTDTKEQKGENISNLFNRIEESKIALAVLSKRYTQSGWCLDELVKMMELADQGKLKVLPIFYNVTTYDVKVLEGEFGIHFRQLEREYRSEQLKIDKWKKALVCVSGKIGFTYDDRSLSESNFIGNIVKEVLAMLQAIHLVQTANSPTKELLEREKTGSRTRKIPKNFLKTPSGKLENTILPEIIGNMEKSSLSPRANSSGHGPTLEPSSNVTVQSSNAASPADIFIFGQPHEQVPRT